MFRQRVILPALCAAVCVAGAIRCGAVDDGFEAPGARGKASDHEQSGTSTASFAEQIQECHGLIGEAKAAQDPSTYTTAMAEVQQCLVEANSAQVLGPKVAKRLGETREIFDDIGVDGQALVPTNDQALAQIAAFGTVAAAVCDEADFEQGSKAQLRCDALAEGFAPYMLAQWVLDVDNYLDFRRWLAKAVPDTNDEKVKECKRVLEEESGSSQMEMNMAQADFGDCVAAANNARLGDKVGPQIKALRMAASQLCGLMVQMSDSPTGSISDLYGWSCISDSELFIASSLDTLLEGK